MKLICFGVLLLIVVNVKCQRLSSSTTKDAATQRPATSRGSTRFTHTPEYSESIGNSDVRSISDTRASTRSSIPANSKTSTRLDTRVTPSRRSGSARTLEKPRSAASSRSADTRNVLDSSPPTPTPTETTKPIDFTISFATNQTDDLKSVELTSQTHLPEVTQAIPHATYEVEEVVDDIPLQLKDEYKYSKDVAQNAAKHEAIVSSHRVHQQSRARLNNYEVSTERSAPPPRTRNIPRRRTDSVSHESKPRAQTTRIPSRTRGRAESQTKSTVSHSRRVTEKPIRNDLDFIPEVASVNSKSRIIEVTENEPDISLAEFTMHRQGQHEITKTKRVNNEYTKTGPSLFASEENSDRTLFRTGRRIQSVPTSRSVERPADFPSRTRTFSRRIDTNEDVNNAYQTKPSRYTVMRDERTPKGRGNKKASSEETFSSKKPKVLNHDTIDIRTVRGSRRIDIREIPEYLDLMRRENVESTRREPRGRSNRRMDIAQQDSPTALGIESINPVINVELQKTDGGSINIETASSSRRETKVIASSRDTTERNVVRGRTGRTLDGNTDNVNDQRRNRSRAVVPTPDSNTRDEKRTRSRTRTSVESSTRNTIASDTRSTARRSSKKYDPQDAVLIESNYPDKMPTAVKSTVIGANDRTEEYTAVDKAPESFTSRNSARHPTKALNTSVDVSERTSSRNGSNRGRRPSKASVTPTVASPRGGSRRGNTRTSSSSKIDPTSNVRLRNTERTKTTDSTTKATTEGVSMKRDTSLRGSSRHSVSKKTSISNSDDDDDEIGESDNYPEHFKALLQKKDKPKPADAQQVGSRSYTTAPRVDEGLVTRGSEKVPIVSTARPPTTPKVTSRVQPIKSASGNRFKNRGKGPTPIAPPVEKDLSNELDASLGTITGIKVDIVRPTRRIPLSRFSKTPKRGDSQLSNNPANETVKRPRTKSIELRRTTTNRRPATNPRQFSTSETPVISSEVVTALPIVEEVDNDIIATTATLLEQPSKSDITKQKTTIIDLRQIAPTAEVVPLVAREPTVSQKLLPKISSFSTRKRGLYPTRKITTTLAPVIETSTVTYKRRTYKPRTLFATTGAPLVGAKPTAHKFSARYRNDLLRGSNFKTSSTPAYHPTVPIITSPRASHNDIPQNKSENDDNVEILTVIPILSTKIFSDNLISDEFLKNGTTTKPTTLNDDKTSERSQTTEKLTIITPEAITETPSTVPLITTTVSSKITPTITTLPPPTTTTVKATTTTTIPTTTTIKYLTTTTAPTTTTKKPTTTPTRTVTMPYTTTVKILQTTKITKASPRPSFIATLLTNIFNNPTTTKLPETTRSYSSVSVNSPTSTTKLTTPLNLAISTPSPSSASVITNLEFLTTVPIPPTTTTTPPTTTSTTTTSTTTPTTTITPKTTTSTTTTPTTRTSTTTTTTSTTIIPTTTTSPSTSTPVISSTIPLTKTTFTNSPTTSTTTEFYSKSTTASTTTTTDYTTTTYIPKVTTTQTTTTSTTPPTTTPIHIETKTLPTTATSVSTTILPTSSTPFASTTLTSTYTPLPYPSTTTYNTINPTQPSGILTTKAYTTPSWRTPFPTQWAPANYVPRFASRPPIGLPPTESTTTAAKNDYVVFGILPNNTVVRKKPKAFASPPTNSFIIYGIFPNNTIVRKYPNGTVVPDDSSEIEVTGLTANNLKDSLRSSNIAKIIASNEITRDPDNRAMPIGYNIQDNTIETAYNPSTIEPTFTGPAEAASSQHILSLTTTKVPPSTTPFEQTKLPSLVEILGPKVVMAYKEIEDETANRTSGNRVSVTVDIPTTQQIQTVTPRGFTSVSSTTKAQPPSVVSWKPVLGSPPTVVPASQFYASSDSGFKVLSEIAHVTTAQGILSSVKPTKLETTSHIETTVPILTTTSVRTPVYSSTTIKYTTPYQTTSHKTTAPRLTSTAYTQSYSSTRSMLPSTSTQKYTTVQTSTPKLTIITAKSTPVQPTTEISSSTMKITTKKTTLPAGPIVIPKNLKQVPLRFQNMVEEIAFLNSLREASTVITQRPQREQEELANRIIALAVGRAGGTTTMKTVTASPNVKLSSNVLEPVKPLTSSRAPKNNRNRLTPQELEDQELLKYLSQLGVSTATKPSPVSSTYGKSNEALLAALLKEQGIGPTTPRNTNQLIQQLQLAALLDQIVVTPKPRTTRRPLTTPRPAPPARPLAAFLQGFQGFGNWIFGAFQGSQLPQETRRPSPAVSGVIVRPRPTTSPEPLSVFSEDSGSLINVNERPRSISPGSIQEELAVSPRPKPRPVESVRPRPQYPKNVEAEDSQRVRGQLVDAAINVTKAFSQFLGAAIQGAASSFQSLINSGSRNVGNYFGSGSIG